MNEYQRKVARLDSRKKWHRPVQRLGKRTGSLQDKAKKVLIVEDNKFNILPIQTTLKRNRIPYDIATNGFMAVERYTKAMENG